MSMFMSVIPLVYVEWDKLFWSCVNFETTFGDLYQITLCDNSKKFNHFTHLRSASGMNYSDIIKMGPHAFDAHTLIKENSKSICKTKFFKSFNACAATDC